MHSLSVIGQEYPGRMARNAYDVTNQEYLCRSRSTTLAIDLLALTGNHET